LEATKGLTQPSPRERAFEKNEVKVSSFGGDLEEANASFAAIFDMDGTLIDNTPYHFKSWQALFKKYGKGELSKDTYYTEISGVPVMETIRRIFGNDHDEAGLKALLHYRPRPAPIKISLFRAKVPSLSNLALDSTLGWNELGGSNVRVHVVPGNHGSMMTEPMVRELAKALSEQLEAAQVL